MAGQALMIVLDPMRLGILFFGVILGLCVGIIPGLGGLVALAMLIPFTYSLDSHAAFALLIGVSAVTTISDVIPAVMFGVPGTVASAATVLDGYPLARKGLAGKALGACYASSFLGGIFGAALLAVSIPILRPLMLYLASPELLAFSVFGLSMVAGLSGKAPIRGLAAAGLGLMVSMVGAGPQTGTMRWTFDSLYLWDGIPIVPITLGLFALPELADLVVHRTQISSSGAVQGGYSMRLQRDGIRAALRHWWLVMRCSFIGSALGAVPGMGSAVIDWVAYGHAIRTEKNPENFGKGDIRGVIAAESGANAKEGGSLVPTIAFGVPGSASMALLLSAFLMHGLVPGPEMLTRHLDVTYAIIWSLVIAHLLGAIICLFASGQMIRIAYVRFSILVPMVLAIACIGAFEGSKSWGDLWVVFGFGVLGWIMKVLGWPRPPLILGVVLGPIFERYLFISIQRYGMEWLTRPVVIIVLALAILGLYRPIRNTLADTFGHMRSLRLSSLNLGVAPLFNVALLAVLIGALVMAHGWPTAAQIVPLTAVWVAIFFVAVDLVLQIFRERQPVLSAVGHGPVQEAPAEAAGEMPPPRVIAIRVVRYFAWILGFLLLAHVIGLLPAMFVFLIAFMRFEGPERWLLSLSLSLATVVLAYLLFDLVLATPWPQSWLGDAFPALRAAVGIV